MPTTHTPEEIEATMLALNLTDKEWDKFDRSIRHALIRGTRPMYPLHAAAPALYAALQLAVQSMEDALSNGPQWAENMEKADLPTIREALHQAEGGIP